MKNLQKRNSNIEWLRIISMIMILAFHGMRLGYTDYSAPLHLYLPGILLGSWGILGVDIFLIISAWFLADEQFKIRKLVSIIIQVGMYILLFAIARFVYFAIHEGTFYAVKDIVIYEYYEIAQPLWLNAYWFMSAYIFLYISSPILNLMYKNASTEIMKKALFIFSFIPIYSHFAPLTSVDGLVGNIINFYYIYFLVVYIKKEKLLLSRKKCVCIFSGIAFIIVLTKLLSYKMGVLGLFGYLTPFLNSFFGNTDRYSILLLIMAICIFMAVLQIEQKSNSVVNFIASYTLGGYLYSEKKIFDDTNNRLIDFSLEYFKHIGLLCTNSILFPVSYLACIFIIFIGGITIEMIRVNLIHKPIMKYLDYAFKRYFDRVDTWMNSMDGSFQ